MADIKGGPPEPLNTLEKFSNTTTASFMTSSFMASSFTIPSMFDEMKQFKTLVNEAGENTSYTEVKKEEKVKKKLLEKVNIEDREIMF